MDSVTFVCASEAETEELAQRLAVHLRGGELIGLEGDLGAGKTAFARALGHGLGVDADEPITSPTFALVQHYEGRVPYVHGDLYRLQAAGELRELGIHEFKEEGAVVVLEWARRFAEHFSDADLWVEIVVGDRDVRTLLFHAATARGKQALGNLARPR